MKGCPTNWYVLRDCSSNLSVWTDNLYFYQLKPYEKRNIFLLFASDEKWRNMKKNVHILRSPMIRITTLTQLSEIFASSKCYRLLWAKCQTCLRHLFKISLRDQTQLTSIYIMKKYEFIYPSYSENSCNITFLKKTTPQVTLPWSIWTFCPSSFIAGS